jgi:hypothetical protein
MSVSQRLSITKSRTPKDIEYLQVGRSYIYVTHGSLDELNSNLAKGRVKENYGEFKLSKSPPLN